MEALFKRLQLRQQRLNVATEEVMTILTEGRKRGALPEETLSLCQLKLKKLLAAFEKELYEYLGKAENANIDEFNTNQFAAEDVLMEIEAALQLNNKSSSAKLPKLTLPKYAGDKLKWTEFWDRFKANVHQQPIAEADKLSYLQGCLEGSALEAVSGLTTTDDNYTIAIEALEKRFGSKDNLIDAHYISLNNIVKADYNYKSCRSVLDEIECHLRVLEKLGEPINGNNSRALVLSKFPNQVVHEHYLITGEENTMAAIRKSLHRIVTTMEKTSMTPISTTTGKPSTSTEALQTTTETVLKKPTFNYKRKQDEPKEGPPAKRAKKPCLFCKMKNHLSADCRKVKSIDARKEKLKGRCLKCLRQNHDTEACRRRISCFRCKENHLMIFCPNPATGEHIFRSSTPVETICDVSTNCTFLQTAVAIIKNPSNNLNQRGRLLLDSGSQRSYITENAAKSLGLTAIREDLLLIYTFGASEPRKTSSPLAVIELKTKRGITRKLQVNIVPQITDKVPVPSFLHNEVDLLADDETTGDSIDLLVGNDYYGSFIRDERIKITSNLYVINTDFGWILSGVAALDVDTDVLSVVTYCQCHVPACPYFAEPDLPLRNIDMKFLWSLESIGVTDSPKATRQEEAVKHFNETVQCEDDRYLVKWPWIQYPPDLASNHGLALGRLRSILKRIDSKTLEEYNNILKEQLELGIIESVDLSLDEENQIVHYLPHHLIKQKGKTGRIVYDASAKMTGNKSLNECLYSGPSMLEDLTALLLKFRTSKIGIISDIEKAFLQVGLQKEDRDVTRFLWIKDISKGAEEDNLQYLRFCRVPFGVISSPFLLTATIRHHMSQSDEDVVKTIADKCYVDNLVTGADSTQEARKIYQRARDTLSQISMNIRDWASNDKQFIETIPEALRDKRSNVKVLGLNWDIEKDILKLKITESHVNPDAPVNTKRKVLRTLARIYDPFGFVCPLVLPMKLLFQKICDTKAKWDMVLPDDICKSLEPILEDLKSVLNLEVLRYIGADTPKKDTKYYLHCFTDASKNAYAAVIYLKAVGEKQISVSFVMAKSRVSQSKDKDDLKIPKLELLGFLIGSRLLKYVRNSLELQIQREYLWTDSLVVLSWMRSNKLLPPFVANRVNEIKRNHAQTDMYYVHTKSNPADIATRPELFKEKIQLWNSGPDFLLKEEAFWPENRHYEAHQTFFSVGEALAHVPRLPEGSMDCPVEQEQINNSTCNLMELGSNVQTRETDNSHDNQNAESHKLVSEVKIIQEKYFPEELRGKKTHLARNLDLFLDVDGILRCRGRMANTNWSYDMKYPILLPKDCDFTNNIIKDTHESHYHVGVPHTLNIIRQRYWIPQGRVQVQKIIKRCQVCIKHGGGPYQLPSTPALPEERVNYSAPFTYTGLDYFGPMFVSTKTGNEKRWICLYTCLAVRAIHMEVVKNLTADECLLALRRFIATRGVPLKIVSDNALQFKLTNEVLSKAYCDKNKIQWKFIPELAPWHGAFYERLIALVKHCLKRTLEKCMLHDTQLLTVIKEVEAVVNIRPLVRVGADLEHVLKPATFLTLGRCLELDLTLTDSPVDDTKTKTDLISSWKRGLRIMEEFKRMFIGQYLTSLRERYNNAPKQPRIRTNRTPKLGDLVQIKSDHKNRSQWKVGEIVSLIEGRDGQCRVAKVKVEDSIFTRSIGHLYPLEADEESWQEEVIDEQADEHSATPDLCLENPQALRAVTPTPEVENNCPVEPMQDVEAPELSEGQVHGTDVDNIPANDVAADAEQAPSPEMQQQSDEEGARGKRDAAIRARDKILEWTRHLLTLLN